MKHYKINRSNFTLKKKHQTLSNGDVVYERDFMTTTNLGVFDGGAFPLGENNFKMITSNSGDSEKKCSNREWVKNDDGEIIWNNKEHETASKDEDAVSQKYNSLLDFCHYGSCEQFIKASLFNIVKWFPAEVYVSEDEVKHETNEIIYEENLPIYKYITIKPDIFTEETNVEFYKIINDFGIDFSSIKFSNKIEKNKFRILTENWENYYVIDSEGTYHKIVDYDVTYLSEIGKKCFKNCETLYKVTITYQNLELNDDSFLNIYGVFYDGEIINMSESDNVNFRISPNEYIINESFNNFEPFEKLMLNRKTNPLFRMELDCHRETENGIETYLDYFNFPIDKWWNIDIVSNEYENYVERLIKLAYFYDEYFTNNLWTKLTHEAIKNLDKTYTIDNNDVDRDDYVEGNGKIEAILKTYASIFDDLKRYIDGIKNTNILSYNINDNVPNNEMTDKLTLCGWDVTSPVSYINENTVVDEVLFNGMQPYFAKNDANNMFLKELLLNSKNIFSKKGTKQGIESLLSLFGLSSFDFVKNLYKDIYGFVIDGHYDYKIDEYSAVAKYKDDEHYKKEKNYFNVEKSNVLKKTYYHGDNSDGDEDTIQGLPVRIVYFDKLEESGETSGVTTYKYIIPWFSKYETIDGNPYFQMYGGWGKGINCCGFYNETVKYLKVAKTVKSLIEFFPYELHNGEIVYVNNINDFSYYITGTTEETNYFIIKDVNNSSIFEEKIDETGAVHVGWEPISENDGRVVYLESIINKKTCNNPHVGYNKYDDGETFFDYFRQLLKYSIENNNFIDEAYDCETGEVLDIIKESGFDITLYNDNSKCWVFKDGITKNSTRFYDSNLSPVNVEKMEIGDDTKGKNSFEEAASYSVMNNKRMTITFKNKKIKDKLDEYNVEENKKYFSFIKESVIPYLNQMIPSTTILDFILEEGREFKYNGELTNKEISDGFEIDEELIARQIRDESGNTTVIVLCELTKIVDNGFAGNKKLISIDIPNTVKEIGKSAFMNCTSLQNVMLNNNINEIKEKTFENCLSLETVKGSDNIVNIGDNAFNNCVKLDNV